MPDIVFTCQCKCAFQRWKRDDEPLEHPCPKCKATVYDALAPEGFGMKRSHLALTDIYDYVSPIDGKHVASKRAHRDHLKRHGVIELGNEKPRLDPFKPSIPREMIREEIKNNVERMKSHGTWRER